ncbi:MAG: type II toxin-antitoxin system VapC family toxin [Nitrospinae bacterium]|nr:type II toxin-antitoxin system VapC family toxin [Nitrospinota bacterium]
MVNIAYFDTSVLVKLYDKFEEGSKKAESLYRKYNACSSILIYAEVISALSRKNREGKYKEKGFEIAISLFKQDIEKVFIIEVNKTVIEETGRIIINHELRALDAIHLASANILRRELSTHFPMITADEKLSVASQKEGYKVFLL